jgi:uncharacterized protein YndB with AHSA1/START domain
VALRIDAPPERVFVAFTSEMAQWWRPNALFSAAGRYDGVVSMEARPGGRVSETYPDGSRAELGQVRVWSPPERLEFSWSPGGLAAGQQTTVLVRFERAGESTRVVLEHLAWDGVPQDHAARHGFPLFEFQSRLAEWWRGQLASLESRLNS